MKNIKSVVVWFLMTICLLLFMGHGESKQIKEKKTNLSSSPYVNQQKYQIFQTIVDNKMGNVILEELGLDKIASSYMILETIFDTHNNKIVSRRAIPLAKYF